ncbi:Exc2 family lipoprotein [Erwinia sp. JH02]|uniref:Exc2 family lipoprotein n=1 Tax=Erwinia sp. JH02 TaxID=2733394 RepID=UPI0014879323|nr:Exc2 family lipoprotein [Erwinia sp. JH02]NNS10025.1 Exc2 family lipoprotein [Erwinia sp. JH02]
MSKGFVLIVLSVLLLSGCIAAGGSDKSSPGLHAARYASGVMDAMPSRFGFSRKEIYNKILPFMTESYQNGRQDREAGVSEAVAEKRRGWYYSDEFLRGPNEYTGADLADQSRAQSIGYRLKDLLAREASAAYWDGYTGR